MKKCKFCDGEINEDAIKCKHCGEYQDVKYKWKGVQVKPGFLDFSKVFCTHCHYQGRPKTITKGSLGIELILWICFIIPGLIYSSYRSKSKYYVCRKCGSDQINKL